MTLPHIVKPAGKNVFSDDKTCQNKKLPPDLVFFTE